MPTDSTIWRPARELLSSVLGAVQNRLELLACEIKEEESHFFELLLRAAAFGVFFMLALGLITFTVVLAFWDEGRFMALTLLSMAHLGSAAYCWRALRDKLSQRAPLASSIDEIKKDQACCRED